MLSGKAAPGIVLPADVLLALDETHRSGEWISPEGMLT